MPLSMGLVVFLSVILEEDCKVTFPPSPVVKILVQRKLFSNYLLFKSIAFRCWLRSEGNCRPPLTSTDWVGRDPQHLGQKLNFTCVCACSVTGQVYGVRY